MTAIKSKLLGDPHDPTRAISMRERLRALATPIQFLKGVGPKRAEQLQAAGLATVEDLLYHLPFRYEDRRQLKKISAALLGQEETFVGELIALQSRFVPRRRMQMMTATIRDATALLDLVWYRAPSYLGDGLVKEQKLVVQG